MTILISLDRLDDTLPLAGPSTPRKHALREAAEAEIELRRVVRAVKAAKRIVVVCGAGVSTAASIPDFRSADGLFSGRINKGKARAKGEGVRDLFHVKSLATPELLEDHQALINDLCDLAFRASPTAFHNFLSRLDDDGQLLRCYTQNIDGLEGRAGLATGIPLAKPGNKRRKEEHRLTPPSSQESNSSRTDTPSLSSTPSTPPPLALEPPPRPIYRCIPLHGDLTTLHCQICSSTYPILPYLPLGPEAIECPQCSANWHKRHAARARTRPVGALRANVVLYGEDHPLGEAIGAAVERDLRGTGPRGEREGKVDFLIVAGTSLSIPGVKRMVKELARSSKASKAAEGSIRTVLVNHEYPRGGEWNDVFDVWVRGDVQKWTAYLEDPIWAAPPTPPKTPAMRPVDKRPSASPKTPTKLNGSGKKGSLSTAKAKKLASPTWGVKRNANSPLKLTISPTRPRVLVPPSPSKPVREGSRKSPRTPVVRNFWAYTSAPHPTPIDRRDASDTDSSTLDSVSDFDNFMRSRFEGSLTPLSDFGTPGPSETPDLLDGLSLGSCREEDFGVDVEMGHAG